MKYKETKDYLLINDKMQNMFDYIDKESVATIITDPPYELNFMGKGWDRSGVAFQVDTWKHCYDALKPGGYLLAFGGSRTFHRVACAIEDAGFEIRDTIMWLYGSGFPKSMNIGLMIDKRNGIDNKTGNILKGVGSNNTCSMKNGLGESQEFKNAYEERKATNQWAGWGTCLKPSYEPIIIARKPFKGSLIDNIEKNGVGAINIDECRVPYEKTQNPATNPLYRKLANYKLPEKGQLSNGAVSWKSGNNDANNLGRFPANTILTYDDSDYEEVCGGMPETKGAVRNPTGKKILDPDSGWNKNSMKDLTIRGFNDEGSASRYFYCAKASKKDRDEGLDEFESNYYKLKDGVDEKIISSIKRLLNQ